MGLYTGTVKGLRRAPYKTQVEVHLINLGLELELSENEILKVQRVHRFLHPYDCALEIKSERERGQKRN
jgi:hypothetical protein